MLARAVLTRLSLSIGSSARGPQHQRRFLHAKKRFYKHVSTTCTTIKAEEVRDTAVGLSPAVEISSKSGLRTLWEVNLDQRKLKTPNGRIFQVPNEGLAAAIAAEWDAQRETISAADMHLTSLAMTCIDNPLNRTSESVADSLISFLDSDTLRYRNDEPPELATLERQEWDPLVDWFEARFACEVPTSTGMSLSDLSPTLKTELRRHLLSHNGWSLVGLEFAADSLKSLILTLALTERRVSVDAATRLSRLETEYQTGRWGRVEWGHDLDEAVTRSRIAAGALFYFLTIEQTHLKVVRDKSI